MYIKIKPIRGVYEIEDLLALSEALGFVICGGYVRWACSTAKKPAPPEDLDIFFPDDSWKNLNGLESHLEKNYEKVFETNQAISFKLKQDAVGAIKKVQVIKPREEFKLVTKGSLENILDNFDFSVTRVAFISRDQVLADSDFVNDEKYKNIRLKNIHCPISSMFRVIKYCGKGYHITYTESLKLFTDWTNRGQEYRDKLMNFIANKDKLAERAAEGDAGAKEELNALYDMMTID